MRRLPRKYIFVLAAAVAQLGAAGLWGLTGAATVAGLLLVLLCMLILMLRWDVRRASNRTRAAVEEVVTGLDERWVIQSEALEGRLKILEQHGRQLDELLRGQGRLREDSELRSDEERRARATLRASLDELSRHHEGRVKSEQEVASAVRETAIALEALGTAASTQHSGTQDLVKDVQRRLKEMARNDAEGWRRRRDELVQEIEAVVNLHELFPVRADMPFSGGWALRPDVLLAAVSSVVHRDAHCIVECGSGTSTVWLGYAAEAVGRGAKVVALEHDPEFAEETHRRIRDHRLEDYVEVRHAPLVDIDLEGESWRWYAPSAWSTLSEIDLLVIDGPPARTQPLARYPALPLFRERLSSGAHILLDDAKRPDEQQAMERWLTSFRELSRTRIVPHPQSVMFVWASSSTEEEGLTADG